MIFIAYLAVFLMVCLFGLAVKDLRSPKMHFIANQPTVETKKLESPEEFKRRQITHNEKLLKKQGSDEIGKMLVRVAIIAAQSSQPAHIESEVTPSISVVPRTQISWSQWIKNNREVDSIRTRLIAQ